MICSPPPGKVHRTLVQLRLPYFLFPSYSSTAVGSAHRNSDLRTHCHAVTPTRRFPTFCRSCTVGTVQKGPQRTNGRAHGPQKVGKLTGESLPSDQDMLHHAGTPSARQGHAVCPVSRTPSLLVTESPLPCPTPRPRCGPAARYGC
jgi:hypothetical protein